MTEITANSTAEAEPVEMPPKTAGSASAAAAHTAARTRTRVDGRRRPARRLKAHTAALSAALGRPPTPAEDLLIRDAAALAYESERLAERAAAGESIDPDQRVRVSGALARALDRLQLLRNFGEGVPDPLADFRRKSGFSK